MNGILERFPGLICPACGGAMLEAIDDGIECKSCRSRYELIDGRFPDLVPADTRVSQEEITVQDAAALHYEASRYANPWSKAYHRWWTDLMVSQVDTGGRILDNGCGVGVLFDRLPGADIIGLDISRQMLRAAGAKSERVLLGDSQRLPFADATFDTVFARSLIHHLPDPEQGLAEMARVLRPGGELVAIDTNRSVLSSLPRRVFSGGGRFSEEHKNLHRRDLLRAFERHLRVERVRFFGYLAYPVLGFPDVKDLFRYFPLKRLSYGLLMATDAVLAHIPGVKTQSWGILVKGRKAV